MGILKGYKGKVIYKDGSYDTLEFKGQNAMKAWVNGIDLTETRTVTVWPVWSVMGEAVSVEVKHQS